MEHMISEAVLQRTSRLRESFQTAKPFKHLCIDDFFDPTVAERLLAEFPRFEPKAAIDEFGDIGGKAVNTDIRNISPAYEKLYAYISSPAFLTSMSDMLGIPDLLFDPGMYGGGTHETLPGRELPPHVDFNYDQQRKLHRRVNVLLYLNKEWDTSWGGAIELHSDPRDRENDRVTTFNCSFNRCVIFETSERSWHGFRWIDPPATKRHLTRKCISIYLYTKDRPRDEIAPVHGTFYVQFPLPDRINTGHAITDADMVELRRLISKRDGWIKYYQEQELKFSRDHEAHVNYINELLSTIRLPLTGYILQKSGGQSGAYADGWVASRLSMQIIPQTPVRALRIRGWIPGYYTKDIVMKAMINDAPAQSYHPAPGAEFDWALEMPTLLSEEFSLVIETENTVHPMTENSDTRDLAFVLKEISAIH